MGVDIEVDWRQIIHVMVELMFILEIYSNKFDFSNIN